MEKLIVNVKDEQKDTLLKLFEMLKLEVTSENSDEPIGSQGQLKSLLDECNGMWADRDLDIKSIRKSAWGDRGV
tara:strand:+ start:4131 stop:4352 length:222 start_codon:yes stop_codon:yes gene_type:complete